MAYSLLFNHSLLSQQTEVLSNRFSLLSRYIEIRKGSDISVIFYASLLVITMSSINFVVK